MKNNKPDQPPMCCPICQGTFLNTTHFLRHAADKHFYEQLRAELSRQHQAGPPFSCPQCKFEGKDFKVLTRHYGLKHHAVVRILNERAGRGPNCADESILRQFETAEGQRESCPLCQSNFGGRYMLLRHLADCHFRERLCAGLPPGGEVFKCPACSHESKDKGGFVRHYGLVHKMVQKWVKEMGIDIDEDSSSSAPSSLSGAAANKRTQQLEVETASDSYQLPPGMGAAAAASSSSSLASNQSFSGHFSPSQQQQQFRPQSAGEAAAASMVRVTYYNYVRFPPSSSCFRSRGGTVFFSSSSSSSSSRRSLARFLRARYI